MFESDHFKALIRKVSNEFEHLVNPVFDLEEIVKQAKPDVDSKYAKDPNGFIPTMTQVDLMMLYKDTFSSPKMRSRLVFEKMLDRYDEFFKKSRQAQEK